MLGLREGVLAQTHLVVASAVEKCAFIKSGGKHDAKNILFKQERRSVGNSWSAMMDI